MPYVFRRRAAPRPRRKPFATFGAITITLGSSAGSFASAGVAAKFALLEACGVGAFTLAAGGLTNFGVSLRGATGGPYSISANGAGFSVAITAGVAGYSVVGPPALLATRMALVLGSYSVTGAVTPLGVLLLSGSGEIDVAGYDASFTRDFEAWFPRPFDADEWINSAIEQDPWMREVTSSESWTIAATQAESWIPAIKQPETWDAE